MKDLIIIGNGSFAELLYYYLREYSTRKVVAFSVNKQYIAEDRQFQDLPLVPLEELSSIYPPEKNDVILAIGQSKMNNVRKKLFYECKEKGYDIASFIHPTAIIPKNTVIGEGNIILENFLIQPFGRIGNGNLFWDNITIAHNGWIGNFNTLSGNVGASGFVDIGNNCYLGKHSMIFDHVKIADYTLLGAGAYAKRDTKPYDVIVPAKSITLEGKRSTDFF